ALKHLRAWRRIRASDARPEKLRVWAGGFILSLLVLSGAHRALDQDRYFARFFPPLRVELFSFPRFDLVPLDLALFDLTLFGFALSDLPAFLPDAEVPLPRNARSAVDDSGDLRPWRNVQAGARRPGRLAASFSGMRAAASAWPAGLAAAYRLGPKRSTTTNGTSFDIPRHRCQRWKLRKLSAPMIQTKRTRGQ